MKTEYTAWAVQVLRDGEWEFASDWSWPKQALICPTREEARNAARWEMEANVHARVRKVRVTVEEG